jgi:acid phosphatase type 7
MPTLPQRLLYCVGFPVRLRRSPTKPIFIVAVALLVVLLFGSGVAADGPEAVLVGAGDIASCSSSGDEATANLLDGISGTVVTLGDNAYENGTATEYANCYDPSWGRHKARTMPAPGNHEYNTPNATGYYGYFGAAAGDPTKGYYSYDLGTWHIVVINSNCSSIGGCGPGSAQEQWLRADLGAHPAACTLAYWHHPRFSSGPHGSDAMTQPIWQALYDYGADLVLSGHDHDYERFALQDPAGNADPVHGIREFVVGTGGRSHYPILSVRPNSEVSDANTYGVLKLSLHPSGYDWQFVPVAGSTFTDVGSGTCVTAAPVGGTSALTGQSGSSRSTWLLALAVGLLGSIAVTAAAYGRFSRSRS